jgi:AcrR family transcriptional regulator
MPRSAQSSDGRVLRGRRNRERIVEALRELVREGMVQPSAQQVAERAGVGERSVYRHFLDMEKLYAEIGNLVLAEVADIIVPGPASAGSLEQRIRGLVAWRARLYERVAPFQRSGSLYRFRSSVIQRQHATLSKTMRGQLTTVFAAELAGAARPVLEALDAVSSYETWERLRDAQKLAPADAARAVEAALRALLPGRPVRARRAR